MSALVWLGGSRKALIFISILILPWVVLLSVDGLWDGDGSSLTCLLGCCNGQTSWGVRIFISILILPWLVSLSYWGHWVLMGYEVGISILILPWVVVLSNWVLMGYEMEMALHWPACWAAVMNRLVGGEDIYLNINLIMGGVTKLLSVDGLWGGDGSSLTCLLGCCNGQTSWGMRIFILILILPWLVLLSGCHALIHGRLSTGPRLNIKTVLSTYGVFHVKDKTAVRTSYL